MKKEEAIKRLTDMHKFSGLLGLKLEERQALSMGIDALEHNPCDGVVLIPKNATNGDVIKVIFGFEPRKNTCILPKDYCNGNPTECDGCKFNDWWNAPYNPPEQNLAPTDKSGLEYADQPTLQSAT